MLVVVAEVIVVAASSLIEEEALVCLVVVAAVDGETVEALPPSAQPVIRKSSSPTKSELRLI